MIIGIVPGDPTEHPDWPKMKAFLEPAAVRGDRAVLVDLEAVWAVYDGELVGCATACLKDNGIGEVPLVGGVESRHWIGALDELIGQWMKAEGMTAMRAFGRKGWSRTPAVRHWTAKGEHRGFTIYERAL